MDALSWAADVAHKATQLREQDARAWTATYGANDESMEGLVQALRHRVQQDSETIRRLSEALGDARIQVAYGEAEIARLERIIECSAETRRP